MPVADADLRALAAELATAERPLAEAYERIARAAPDGVLRRLAEHMARAQRFQLATLDLVLSDRVPDAFLCFGRITHEDVKVRSAPSPRAEVLRTCGRGAAVIVKEARGNWQHVQFSDGASGWVFKDYVRCELGL